MRTRAFGFALTALFASLAAGQTSAQPSVVPVFNFNQSDAVRDIREMTTMVRTVANMNIGPDTAQQTLPLSGTAEQVALAEWLLTQLDRPAPASRETALYDYQAGKPDSAVRVFRLAQTDTPQGFQEITIAIRAIGDVQRLYAYSAQRSLVVRGTADQAALAEWLVNQLDQAAPPNHEPAAYEYQEATPGQVYSYPAVRVFRLTHIEAPQDLQEIANAIRTMADVMRVIPNDARRVVVMRGTADQAALAEWLVNELDQPAGAQSSAAQRQNAGGHEMQVPGSDQVVHVFHLANPLTSPQFQAINDQARLTLKITKLFFMQQAVVVRGTTDQIAAAGQLIQQTVKP
jgi:type II secretory pathway component GspD/PulD (secretin)